MLSLFFVFSTSLTAAAQEGIYSGTELQNVLKQDTYEPNYFTLIFGLIFVIFLIYLTGFFYQKLIGVGSKLNKKAIKSSHVNKVNVISSMPLGRDKNVYVIEINGKTLVLGATDNQINLLREFSESEVNEYAKNIAEILEEEDE